MAKKVWVEKSTTTLREQIKNLLSEIDGKKYDLYLLIRKVHEDQSYLKWGFETFKDYIETDLKIPYRIGLWYVQIGGMIETLRLTKETVLAVSWTKLKEIATVMDKINPEQALELIDKAKNMTFRDLQTTIQRFKKVLRQGETTEIEITKLIVELKEDQADVVLSAIGKAKELLSTDSTASALELICQEWLLKE